MTYGFLYNFVMVFFSTMNKKPLTNQITLPTIEYGEFCFFTIRDDMKKLVLLLLLIVFDVHNKLTGMDTTFTNFKKQSDEYDKSKVEINFIANSIEM